VATSTGALAVLRTALGNPAADFRDGQWEAIDGAVNLRERQLVVQRTGWGKSIVYFLATRLLRDQGRGPTLIVSPLLALMRNQVDAAQALGLRAITINSSNADDWPELIQQVLADEVDALLLSPERLANEEFVETVLQPIAAKVGLLVVDEVHCISDWGHDFRPDYRRLAGIVRQLPRGTPLLGMTATANDRVLADIQTQLGQLTIRRGPLTRESLVLDTIPLPSREARLAWLSERIPALSGSGIVYVLTQRDAELVAEWLRAEGVNAQAYHSKVTHPDFEDVASYREHLETLLLNDGVKALVATTALGMGYDKKNLGFAIHFQAPGSIIAYYQQVGRAGRALDRAFGVLMTGAEDSRIHEFFRRQAFPAQEEIDQLLSALASSNGLTVQQLEARINLGNGQIKHVLTFLAVESPSPVLKVGSTWKRTPVRYRLDSAKVARLTRQREEEWSQVQAYIAEPGCLMAFLATELDDPTVRPCGRCSRCTGRAPLAHSGNPDLVRRAREFLRRNPLEIRPRKQVPKGAFSIYDWSGRIPGRLQHQVGRALSSWGVDELGEMVKQDKLAGTFRPDLVRAAAGLVSKIWRPAPPPLWVTCIPSARHTNLVPVFARALAGALGIPFRPVIALVRTTAPQKQQNNSFHQCSNLDGAFQITGSVPHGPVLLVDDMVDSGWTFAVASRLLLEAGSGTVFPFALARTGMGD
jgi:ATP-dependent DNA helicase RecQ